MTACIVPASIAALIGLLGGVWLGKRAEQDDETAVPLRCSVCGEAYYEMQAALDHLRDAHNAPGGRADISDLIDRGEPNQ